MALAYNVCKISMRMGHLLLHELCSYQFTHNCIQKHIYYGSMIMHTVCLPLSHAGEYQNRYDELTKDTNVDSKFVCKLYSVTLHPPSLSTQY